jgi:DNA polymerase I-like protein with 3'-5' exonuclease and polymerase domains
MESAYEMKTPLKVDVKAGKNWAEMEPVAER